VYVWDLLNTKHEYSCNKNWKCKNTFICCLSWLTLECHVINTHTHTFPIHSYTLSVTHPHEQNTRHLNLLLFIVQCTPSLSCCCYTKLHTLHKDESSPVVHPCLRKTPLASLRTVTSGPNMMFLHPTRPSTATPVTYMIKMRACSLSWQEGAAFSYASGISNGHGTWFMSPF
jgi:hypothetical protein